MKSVLLISTKHKFAAVRSALVTLLLLSVLLSTGCATFGSVEKERIDAIALAALPPEHSVYLYIDVASGAEFLEETALLFGADPRRIEGLLSELSSAYLALDVSPMSLRMSLNATPGTSERGPSGTPLLAPGSGDGDWTCIATGRIRVGSYASALNLNSNWKRVRGLGRYWISTDSDLEIALPGRQIAVVGNSEVQPVVERLARTTASTTVRSSTAAAAAGVPAPDAAAAAHPALELYRLLSRRPGIGFAAYLHDPMALLPLQLPPRLSEGVRATVAGSFTDDTVEAELILRFPSPATARVAGVLVKTIVIAELKKAGNRETARVEVSVQEDTVSVSPVVIGMQDAVAFLLPFAMDSGESQ